MGIKALPFHTLSAGAASGLAAGCRRTALSLALAGAALLAAGPTRGAEPAATATVPVLQAQHGDAGMGLAISGSLQPRRQATLGAQGAGSVVALAVKAGDRVKAGQVLARIDPRDAAAALMQGDAALAQAQAQQRLAQTQLERSRELQRQGFVSSAALDTAEQQAQAARAAVLQAQAARAQAALAREFTQVVAPFDGVVAATHLEAGDLAAPGRPVLTLYAPGEFRAVVHLTPGQSAAARAARRTEIELPDGRRVPPTRVQALASADPVSQTVEWRLDLADAGAALPGQQLRVFFDGAPATKAADATLWLPEAALLQRGELQAVYVARDGRFELRAVRTGARSAGRVELLAGLREGESVAADALRAGLAGAKPAAAAR